MEYMPALTFLNHPHFHTWSVWYIDVTRHDLAQEIQLPLTTINTAGTKDTPRAACAESKGLHQIASVSLSQQYPHLEVLPPL